MDGVLTQETLHDTKTSVSNVTIIVGRIPIELNSVFKVTALAGVILPTNDDDHRINTFDGGAQIAPRILYNVHFLGLNTNGFVQTKYVRNFHEFDRSGDGTANLEQVLSERLNLNIPIVGGLSITGEFIYATGWTYQSATKETYATSEEIGYDIDKSWSVSLGHAIKGPLFKANGRDSNFETFDKYNSQVYLNLTFVQ